MPGNAVLGRPVLGDARLGARLALMRGAGLALAVAGDPVMRLLHRPWRDDPHPTYARMRAAPAPVRSRTGMLAVASAELCGQVVRDRRYGVRDRSGGIPGQRTEGRERDRAVEPMDLSFLGMDPPDHTRLRRLAQVAFTPRTVAGYRPMVERLADRLVADAARRDTFDLVADVAAPLPVAVIAAMLGVPDADSARFRHWGHVLGGALGGLRSVRQAHAVDRASVELRDLLGRLLDEKRDAPRDDLLSRLATADATAAERVSVAALLLLAGFETTANLVGNATAAMLDAREPWRALASDPAGLAGAAVEEALRFDPPVPMTMRIPHVDVELAGRPVAADTPVLALLAAAGRDPAVHRDPDTFDLHRPTRSEHLAFSGGVHYCVGAPLARLEAEVAIRVLAERLPRLRRAGSATRRASPLLRGYRTLPVAVR